MGRIKGRDSNLDILNKVGVFAGSLLCTAFAVYFYSPVVGTNAATERRVDLFANVDLIASLSLNKDEVNFSVMPSDAGSFYNDSIIATINTNSSNGYELYFSSVDNETNMKHQYSAVTDVIASNFNGTVTYSTMASNQWGFSLNNTDYSKIPTLDNQAIIMNLNHRPSAAEKTATITIGTKVDSNIMAGSYTKNVIFSAIAHESAIAMQNFDGSTLPTGKSLLVEDLRDGEKYTIKKLLDGNVWMTQNLRISDITIDSTKSDMTSGSYAIPASISGSFSNYFNADDTDYVFVKNNVGYYAFYTASVGTGGTSMSTSGDNIQSSICPKGWKIPSGKSNDSDYGLLADAYGKSPVRLANEAGLPYTGYTYNTYQSDYVSSYGSSARYWTSTISNGDSAYIMRYDSDDETTYLYFSSGKKGGYPVLCVLR